MKSLRLYFALHQWSEIKQVARDWKVVTFFTLLLGLTTFVFSYSYHWQLETYMQVGIIDLVSCFLNFTLIILFRSKKTLLTYIYFVTIFRVIQLIFISLGIDATNALGAVSEVSWLKTFAQEAGAFKITVHFGFAIANSIIFIVSIIVVPIAILEAWLLRRNTHHWKIQMLLLLAFFAILTFTFYFLMESIHTLQNFMGDNDFKLVLHDSTKISNKYFNAVAMLTFFIWIPLVLTISNITKSDIIPSYQFNLSFAMKIIFIVKMEYFIGEFEIHGKVTGWILMTLVIISVLPDIFIIIRTIKLNYNERLIPTMTPHIFSKQIKRNQLVNIYEKV